MVTRPLSRRRFGSLLAAGATALPLSRAHESKTWQDGQSLWPLCLDTATIRPQTLEDKIRLAAKHGFDAIEPWDKELHQYEQDGGDLKDLGQRIKDAGLFVPSVIGLWKALARNDAEFEANLPACRERMRQAAAIGAQHVQVIPWWDKPRTQALGQLDRAQLAKYYRRIVEIGREEYHLQPGVVFLQFVPDLRTLEHAIEVARPSRDIGGCVIPDTFHMHVGGSDLGRLGRIPGKAIAIYQFADAPDGIPREKLQDGDRVLPGDGILPLAEGLRHLHAIDYRGAISLELYNKSFYERDPDEFLQEAHEKMLKVVSTVG